VVQSTQKKRNWIYSQYSNEFATPALDRRSEREILGDFCDAITFRTSFFNASTPTPAER
jgi:hypothetical protein